MLQDKCNLQKTICRSCSGIFLIICGLLLVSQQILVSKVTEVVRQNVLLIEGRQGYTSWSSPIYMTFACYLFNVTNPDEVMRGDNPNIVEYGPVVYDEIYEKQVIDVDEENDEIAFTTKSTYTFNKQKSMNISKRDKITILNPAYIGSISMLASLPSDFMQKYGNNIPKLFQNHSSIFLKARATDILFDGVKVTCNSKKFPELGLICKTMKAKPPPVLEETDREDVYALSVFQRTNATYSGPFTINRGLKNISRLGDLTSYMGKRVQIIWNSDDCNTVRGTDTVTWAPIVRPLQFVSTFIPDLCRTIEADYEDDISIIGIMGSRFVMKERVWFPNKSECYCPVVKKELQCLPQGLLDVSDCQKVPIILSEPHFLHGDPELLKYARGLNPNEELHGTYIVLEPYTGTPLSGRKKTQLNLKLTKQPVDLLSNVSEGYFPIMWCEDGNTATISAIPYTYQILRLIQVVRYLQYIPLILGVYIIFITLLFHDFSRYEQHPKRLAVQSILISSSPRMSNAVQQQQQRSIQMF